MATPPELHDFIKNGFLQRIPREQLIAVLKENGWKSNEIEEAFVTFAQPAVQPVVTVLNPTAVPVYTPAPYGQPGAAGSLSMPAASTSGAVLPPSQMNPKKKKNVLSIFLNLIGICVLLLVLGVAAVYVGNRVAPSNALVHSSHLLLVKLIPFFSAL